MPDQKHVQRNVGPNKVHEKPKDFKKSMKKLLMWDKKLLPFYILAIIFAISGSICSIIGPNGLSNLTDTITEGVLTGINFDKIKSIGIFLLTVYVISGILTFLTGFIMATTANKLAKKLRTNISQKINKLPLRYYDTHSFGDVLSRVTNDVDTIGMSISHSLGTFVHAVALLLSSVVMMFYTNWMMALTAILTSLIGFIFMFLILSKSQKYFNERQVDLGNLNGHIEEMYSGYNVVKVYNGKKKSIETFKKLNEKLFNCSRKSQFLSGLMQPIMNFIGNFGYVAVCNGDLGLDIVIVQGQVQRLLRISSIELAIVDDETAFGIHVDVYRATGGGCSRIQCCEIASGYSDIAHGVDLVDDGDVEVLERDISDGSADYADDISTVCGVSIYRSVGESPTVQSDCTCVGNGIGYDDRLSFEVEGCPSID